MIGGVSFQPGGDQDGQSGQAAPPRGTGVQEAIKVLSLRLPKVVGAQGVTPRALLSSQGSGGNRVDSVLNQVFAKMFPTGQPQGAQAPMAGGPSVGGAQSGTPKPSTPMPAWPWNQQQTPRVIIGGPEQPMRWPGQATVDGGGQMPGLISELPANFQPQQPPPFPNFNAPVFRPEQTEYPNPLETPLL